MGKVLYVGWLGFNNLGDEIMWSAFKRLAHDHSNKINCEVFPYKMGLNNIDPFDTVVLGGGSLLTEPYIDVVYRAAATGKKVLIWGSGIDWINKQKLEQFMNNQIDVESLLGTAEDTKLREIMAAAHYVGVRGPLTYRALKQAGTKMDNVKISGDPAFLLRPEPKQGVSHHKEEWFNRTKIVGLNWGTARNRLYGGNEEAVENSLALVAKELINQGFGIYMYCVWGNDRLPANRLYEKIGDSKNVMLEPRLLNYYELLDIMTQREFTINFKLHANVVSSVANTPFVALGYRFKVFDFALSTGLGEYVVPTDATDLTKQILSVSESCLVNKKDIVSTISKYRSEYKGYLELPFTNGSLTS